MNTTYEVEGNKVIRVFRASGEREIAAYCETPAKAIEIMTRAYELNDARKYTQSARMLATLDRLPGFAWYEAQPEFGL